MPNLPAGRARGRHVARRLLIALLTLLPGFAPAEELRFITIDVAPWAALSEEGGAWGVFPEVVGELEARTGHRIRMTFEPFARIGRELDAGHQDCTIIIWNDARSAIVERGALVSPHSMGVIARRGVPLREYRDIGPLVVSVLRGATITPRFDGDPAIRKDFDTDYLIGIRKLAHGRVDAVAGAVATIRHLARQEGYGDALGEALVLAEVPLLLQCARRSPHIDLMPELNRAIEAMVADGTIERIKRRHGF